MYLALRSILFFKSICEPLSIVAVAVPLLRLLLLGRFGDGKKLVFQSRLDAYSLGWIQYQAFREKICKQKHLVTGVFGTLGPQQFALEGRRGKASTTVHGHLFVDGLAQDRIKEFLAKDQRLVVLFGKVGLEVGVFLGL